MSTATILMSASQYLQLGEDAPGVRRELVNGEIIASPSPNLWHSAADRALTIILGGFIEARDLGRLFGDVDNALSPLTVRRPDLFYFSKDRLHLLTTQKVAFPPNLCVEIIGPSSDRTDRVDKLREYADFGVANYWIMDPAKRTAEAYVPADGSYISSTCGKADETVNFPPFPDWDIPLAKLWWPGKQIKSP